MKLSTKTVFFTVLFCFFASGAAGLIYQVVWTRYLALFLGHTSYAVVAVLVAFMGGLALGNAWFGVQADRSNKPLALYGWLEIGIGVYAFLFPLYYRLCHDAFIFLARQLEPGTMGVLWLKFLFSFLTILLPTFLMGATFPVLTRFITRTLSELREKVAALYCINSVGAVAGTLIADFWWVPALGLEVTVYGGAVLNLIVGIVALYISFRLEEGKQEEKAAPAMVERAGNRSAEEQFTPIELKLAILGIGLSGFVAMLYEVAWTRFLGLALGSSTHAFSIMLVTFITGIAAGAWLIYRWRTPGRSLEAFAWAELALAVTMFVSMFFYEALPYWFLRLANLLSRHEHSYVVFQGIQAVVCFTVMFIPALCLGTTLPLASRVATFELARTGRSVGKVFAVNTLGTVLGAIVTGLWIMPLMGLPRTFAVGIALNAFIALSILVRHRLTLGWAIASPMAAALLVWFAGLMFDDTWQRTLSLGFWRHLRPPPSFDAFRQLAQRENLRYHKDGASSTVTIVSSKVRDKEEFGLKVNGKADASTGLDVATQRLAGHIPMLLKPDSERVLVVGFGSGMTCGSLLRHSSVQRVDAVEISPEVIEASQFFAGHNDRVLENPKMRVYIEDAKTFLKVVPVQYDIIISEPSNPWMAGVAGVFSREYYESCLDRLKPGGLMAQWVQLYETSDSTLDMVLNTFSSVFPFMSIWHTTSGDLLLVGTPQAYTVDLAALEKRYADPAVQSDLERTDIARLSVLLSREIVSAQNGVFIVPPNTPAHSDYYPTLEYAAQKALFLSRSTERWRTFDETFATRPTTLLGQYLKKNPLTEADYKALGRFFLEQRLPEADLFRSLLVRWQSEKPKATLPMEMMAQASEMVLTAELEALRLAPMADFLYEQAEKDPEPLRMYCSYLMQMYRAHRSVFYAPPSDHLEAMLHRLIETNPARQRIYYLHLAEIASDHGNDPEMFRLANLAFDPDIAKGGRIDFSLDRKAPRIVLARMIETLWRAGKGPEAWNLCQDAKRNKYTGSDDLLDMVVRKVETTVPAPLGRKDEG